MLEHAWCILNDLHNNNNKENNKEHIYSLDSEENLLSVAWADSLQYPMNNDAAIHWYWRIDTGEYHEPAWVMCSSLFGWYLNGN